MSLLIPVNLSPVNREQRIHLKKVAGFRRPIDFLPTCKILTIKNTPYRVLCNIKQKCRPLVLPEFSAFRGEAGWGGGGGGGNGGKGKEA